MPKFKLDEKVFYPTIVYHDCDCDPGYPHITLKMGIIIRIGEIDKDSNQFYDILGDDGELRSQTKEATLYPNYCGTCLRNF